MIVLYYYELKESKSIKVNFENTHASSYAFLFFID